MKRGTNAIDDLLPGVTLTLKAPTIPRWSLSIKHDTESIKKQVETLIGAYDGIATDIDILTRKDDSVIADATYLNDEDRKKAQDNLGLFMGDLSLQQLKSSMQSVMMNPYPTSLGHDLSLLAQIGISTDNRAPATASIDRTRSARLPGGRRAQARRLHRRAPRSGETALRQRHHRRPCDRFGSGIPSRRSPAPLRTRPAACCRARIDARFADHRVQQGYRGLQGQA